MPHSRIYRTLIIIVFIISACMPALCWNEPVGQTGPIKVTIAKFGEVKQLRQPIAVQVTVENSGKRDITGSIRMAVTDQWRIEGPVEKVFVAPAADSCTLQFTVIAGPDSYAAHYPVHAYASFRHDGEVKTAHAVYVTTVAASAARQPGADAKGLGKLTAFRTASPIKVDGDIADWRQAPPVVPGAPQVSIGSLQPSDFGVILRLSHDDAKLYLGLQVTDDDISADDTTSRDFVNSDYIRLYASPQPSAERQADTLTENDLVLAINPMAAGGPRIKIPEYDAEMREIADFDAIDIAANATGNGYHAEIAVPLQLIGKSIQPPTEIGFNLMVGDSDGGSRQCELTVGGHAGSYWTDPRNYVTLKLSDRETDRAGRALPVTEITGRRSVSLEGHGQFAVTILRHDREPKLLPLGVYRSDEQTGAMFRPGKASRPDARPALCTHPPYRKGTGYVAADAKFALPDITPITFTFATAIRDNREDEPPSDGVEWKVKVAGEGGEFRTLFERFSDAKTWQPAEVDLSKFAGETIILRLMNGPGPENNTVCDAGYWGEPTLIVGKQPEPLTDEQLDAQLQKALQRARAACQGKNAKLQWTLGNKTGQFGAGFVPGPKGIIDGTIAFATQKSELAFQGFVVKIDGEKLGDWRSGLRIADVSVKGNRQNAGAAIIHEVMDNEGGEFPVQVDIRANDGSLSLSFTMPDVERNKRGEPRFTRIGPGPATIKARRVHAGFGNVIEKPEKFSLRGGGFGLSTRHIGIEFPNGISIVQAADVFPYRFVVNPDERVYSLRTGHDATMTFIPSSDGAFAAAREYRDIADFQPGGGVSKLKGKMVIDWWGGHRIADDIQRAAAYGLHDCVFIKHNWQRWGYDYRLPDIYPPNCDPEIWREWTGACRDAGMLFGVHDNYIDFYPDATGFSYDYILFNPDGTPQKAWLNEGRQARSYRWRPGAYMPWLKRNIHLIKQGFAPTAYFIDVFSAIPPLDYFDRDGNFHTKMECIRHWGAAFDYVRKQLGDNAPQISEAGHDALIGHLDGAQSDHQSAAGWGWECEDANRVPWHDMASHDSFVLLAGGLGHRYAGDKQNASWGSDDYLSNTVIGGRNPMCIGPCRRSTVMTYWLQHDICNELAHQSLETHEFVGGNIYRQHTTFSGGAQVWTNRGEKPWKVAGRTLPQYGYIAKAGNIISEISMRDGLACRRAASGDITFVDARPIALDTASRAPVKTKVTSAEHLGDGKIDVTVQWEVLKPLPEGYKMFSHVCHEKETQQGEHIAIHASNDLNPEKLQQIGTHECHVTFRIKPDMWAGDYYLRYGIYSPESGRRLVPIGYLDDTRVRGGIFHVKKENGAIASVKYEPEVREVTGGLRKNTDGRTIQFDAIETNGAFRLIHGANADSWTLLPLQGSLAFRANLDLAALGAEARTVKAVVGLKQKGTTLNEAEFQQGGDTLQLDLDANAFKYRIDFQ